jgi:hypothetical protein
MNYRLIRLWRRCTYLVESEEELLAVRKLYSQGTKTRGDEQGLRPPMLVIFIGKLAMLASYLS